ncbi:hypothetical protein Tco_0065089 [Tanacetum coccineum]
MGNLNLTMEEYIRLEEEKARKRRKVFNWQTATYGKIRVDDDFYDLRSMEAEFPAIVVNGDFAPQDTLQCKSQVSTTVNDEIDFRISFDESDDEDYTIICDKNSFSYKMISVNNLKTDSKNDYEKVMPSIPSPEPAISYCDDLDFFKYFENEFPAIVYNAAQTSKSNLLTEPILNPQHIDEFDLNDETSLSEYDEEEQNVLYFNDLFSFNIIRPDDLKSKKDNDNNEIDTIQSFEDNEITHGSTMLFETNMALPPCEQRHRFLRYEGLEYTDSDIADFESRMAMEHRDEAEVLLDLDAPKTIQFQLGGAKRRLSWRKFILVLGLHNGEEMESPGFARDPVLRLCHRMMVHIIAGRSKAPEKILGGLTVIAPKLLMIDMAELVRLQICVQLDDTWAWVAMGPERQPDAVAGSPTNAEDAMIVNEGDQAVSTPVQGPQQPPPPLAVARTIPQRLGRLEEDVLGLRRDVGSLHGLVERSMTDQGRFSMWMMSCMTQLMDASGLTYQAFDGTFRGSSSAAFQRRTRQRTGEASTSAA